MGCAMVFKKRFSLTRSPPRVIIFDFKILKSKVETNPKINFYQLRVISEVDPEEESSL